jgi:hypothetical protein
MRFISMIVRIVGLAALPILLLIALSTGCQRRQTSVLSYGGLHFYGSSVCDEVSIDPKIPRDVEIVLSNDTKVEMSVLERSSVATVFGNAVQAGTTPGKEFIETFKIRECEVTYINGRFKYLRVREPAQIINLRNGKSVTLPATHAEIKAAFGEPTETGAIESQQP